MKGHKIIPKLALRLMRCQSLSGQIAMCGYTSSIVGFDSMMHTGGDTKELVVGVVQTILIGQ